MIPLTPAEISIIRKTVGVTTPYEYRLFIANERQLKRNQVIASPHSEIYNIITKLEEKGLMGRSKPLEILNNQQVFYLTEKGKELAYKIINSKKP